MFQTLRRILSRIRLVVGGIRSGLYGLVMVAITWIVALPPSAAEIAQLNLATDATVAAEGLRVNRMAKLLVLVATDRTYDMIAKRSGAGMSAQDVRSEIYSVAYGTAKTPQATRSRTGAKFVSARTN